MDLTQFAKTQFHAGPPTTATERRMSWDGHDYTMAVELDENDAMVAIMTSGNMEWRCYIGPSDIKGHIDAALEDACDLGRTVNYSRDPER